MFSAPDLRRLIFLFEVSFSDSFPWANNTPNVATSRVCLRAVRRGNRVTLVSSNCDLNHLFLCLHDDEPVDVPTNPSVSSYISTNPDDDTTAPASGTYSLQNNTTEMYNLYFTTNKAESRTDKKKLPFGELLPLLFINSMALKCFHDSHLPSSEGLQVQSLSS
jgi:hypothetical protein